MYTIRDPYILKTPKNRHPVLDGIEAIRSAKGPEGSPVRRTTPLKPSLFQCSIQDARTLIPSIRRPVRQSVNQPREPNYLLMTDDISFVLCCNATFLSLPIGANRQFHIFTKPLPEGLHETLFLSILSVGS
ncbi:hypothetical protein EYC84_003458 [Monilinia fructicola]|uniref:Uncharacterized protein n=1 Tax=Monilinia fructicola TaxID=38448 RepID=A0A5M9JW94_MONFR|nr:hypothetical protein EYC84_003458 [Monilinia fructicola]